MLSKRASKYILSPDSCLGIMHASEQRRRAQLRQTTFSDYVPPGLSVSLRQNIMQQMTVLYVP